MESLALERSALCIIVYDDEEKLNTEYRRSRSCKLFKVKRFRLGLCELH